MSGLTPRSSIFYHDDVAHYGAVAFLLPPPQTYSRQDYQRQARPKADARQLETFAQQGDEVPDSGFRSVHGQRASWAQIVQGETPSRQAEIVREAAISQGPMNGSRNLRSENMTRSSNLAPPKVGLPNTSAVATRINGQNNHVSIELHKQASPMTNSTSKSISNTAAQYIGNDVHAIQRNRSPKFPQARRSQKRQRANQTGDVLQRMYSEAPPIQESEILKAYIDPPTWHRETGVAETKWRCSNVTSPLKCETPKANAKKRRRGKAKKTRRSPEAYLDKLPTELLNHILEYAVVQDGPIHVDALFRSLPKKERQWKCGIMYVCKRFHAPARAAYYSQNTFVVSLAAFQTLGATMKQWPNLPIAAFNLMPALANVEHVVLVRLGPGERVCCADHAWYSLAQFLKAFKQLMVVELDYRGYLPGGIKWNTETEQAYAVEEARWEIVMLMQDNGVRFGWEKRENGVGIKRSALLVRRGIDQKQRGHSWQWAEDSIITGLTRGPVVCGFRGNEV